MKVSVIRVIATLLLSGQMLPVGLSLLSDQVIGRFAGSSWNGTRRGMQFRQLILAASALVMAGAPPVLGQGSPALIAGDSVLQSLVAEALDRNPTVAQRQAAVRAATLRIRPAGSLPDPMLTVGVMDLLLPHFEVNRSDFTDADVELGQEVPWPGSLGARAGGGRA